MVPRLHDAALTKLHVGKRAVTVHFRAVLRRMFSYCIIVMYLKKQTKQQQQQQKTNKQNNNTAT